MTRSRLIIIFSSALAVALGGCAVARVSMPAVTLTMARGYYQQALASVKGEIGARNSYHDLLWNLQAGSLERILKNYTLSNYYFDRAEDAFRYYDRQAALGRSLNSSKALVFNDSALPYAGHHYDRIMVNTYKALNYAALGDFKRARVEFNRARVRQNEAKAFYAAEIERLKAERADRIRTSGTGSDVVSATLDNPELNKIIAEHYANLNAYKVYTDFTNPFTTYVSGLFFWLEGDRQKAVDLLKAAYAMSSENRFVAEDFTRASNGKKPSGEAWVIFENGLAPARKEIRIDIPVILLRRDVKYVGTAFTTLTEGKDAYTSLTVSASGQREAKTEPVASLESVIVQEFKKNIPIMTVREVSRIAMKTYFQYQMNQNYGFLAGLAGGIYQASTTAADVRAWSALPNGFQVAHVKAPKDGRVTITTPDPGVEPVTINLPTDMNNVIIYVRIVAAGVAPEVDLIKF